MIAVGVKHRNSKKPKCLQKYYKVSSYRQYLKVK